MFPYLDLAGFQARSLMPATDITTVETVQTGFTVARIAVWSSWINARLRKRYGNSPSAGNALPLGQQPPALVAAGTNPPSLTLTGRPVLGSMQVRIAVQTGGAVGTATFLWSSDGSTPSLGPLIFSSAAPVVLGTTGVSVSCPSGATFSADNVYAAAPPVPETVLGWIVALVTVDLYRKRGVNPQDPQIDLLVKEAERAFAEIKEAADSKEGLFDLPASEDVDSAVTTGGPMGYSEQSPYVWADRELHAARNEDDQGRGTS